MDHLEGEEYVISHATNGMVFNNLCKVIIITLSFIKIVNFLKVFEGFASLITMISTVVFDLKYFITFYFLLIVLFTTLQKSLLMHFAVTMEDLPKSGSALLL